MKKLILVLTIIFNSLVFGQRTTFDKIKNRDTVPICYEVAEPIINKKVDEKAKLVGGINAFKKLIQEKFDKSVMENEKTGFAKINFVVDDDGSMYKIEIYGKNKNFNSELIRVIKSIKEKMDSCKN